MDSKTFLLSQNTPCYFGFPFASLLTNGSCSFKLFSNGRFFSLIKKGMEDKSLGGKKSITRRTLLRLFGCGAISTFFITACSSSPFELRSENIMIKNSSQTKDSEVSLEGVILARPSNPTGEAVKPGLHSLQFDKNRAASLYVPREYKPENPAPLAIMLHGAGGNAQHGMSLLRQFADETGIILFAPKSLHSTWDVIADEYGVDVQFIDEALKYIFERCAVDASRIAVGGFSDGASYALSLGIINGELFSHIIAFSPGFMAPTRQAGKPLFYISHGTKDQVLPIERCSRRIVPQLQRKGFDVAYREFDGPHTIPPEIATEAVQWFTK
jgi:phospholipase/carboxylesterase